MSDDDLPPLDPEVRALIGRAAKEHSVPASVRQNLETRLGSLFALPGDAVDVGADPKSGITRLPLRLSTWVRTAATFAAGLAAGAGGHAALERTQRPEIRYVDHVVTVVPDAGTSSTEFPAAAPNATPSTTQTVVPQAPTKSRKEEKERDADLGRELSLIDTAQTALARKDPLAALNALERHENMFPRGRLAEQREALAVSALAGAGRLEEARARAAAFRRKYPNSMFEEVVRTALENGR